MIDLSAITKRYPGGHEALAGINLHIEAGELLFVTGHSGAGKSTLLKLIGAIERPTSGHLAFGGQDITRLTRATLPYLRRQIGMVFQNHKLLYDRTVLDNILLPLRIQDMGGPDAHRRARAALVKVGLEGKERVWPVTLSGGEQQRVCIARAIVAQPKLLLADEPTANLDEEYALAIMDIFREFNRNGVTVLISTHDQRLVARYGGRRIHLTGGRLVPLPDDNRSRNP